jgi:O-antigen ligase
LASKNLRKDAEGINQLTLDDIRAVEHGVANYKYTNLSSLKGRIYETWWEFDLYKRSGDPNGHSLTQRFEYWKTALAIITENRLIGVGTGDVKAAIDEQYEKSNSTLYKEFRLRTHNQYLSIAIAFGSIGLAWFLFTLIYPMLKQKMLFDYLYITFFIITVISFFTEDTLETQAGATFFAFFNSFFLLARADIQVRK